ncbi:TMEM175 family protein [Facklamia sp. 7083-14-GEN3]|uniref:TMEM175 family protein n=1 Tax=Facklamia sp. 7083-14-GEN3 TaxID=2973478 RepID=UPI00215C1296|nr:TMEM175 family protein [Facklamia sp. 7083-14-GEN3]MCR8969677.1 TMEM175 family protein [Facklamia sp. 7083-14-GEN3]
MSTSRVEAFSDGVLAIVITIMVLKLQTPDSLDMAGLKEIYPTLLAYILSYAYVGIYWANHHHLLAVLQIATGKILWRNLLWLFFMTLIPTSTEWMGLNPSVEFPAFFYGFTLLMCALTYNILQTEVIRVNGKDSAIAERIGKDLKGKGSLIGYLIALVFSLYIPMVSYVIYVAIAILWFIPDKRLESILHQN